MAKVVFQGGSPLTLDGKGRMTVPARQREALAKTEGGDQLTVTKHPKRCLLIFPRPAWEDFREKLLATPVGAEGWRRLYLGGAVDVEVDSASRILVPPELREWAGLERDVMLLGMGHRFELWDRARHAEHEAEVLAAEMPTALMELVL